MVYRTECSVLGARVWVGQLNSGAYGVGNEF